MKVFVFCIFSLFFFSPLSAQTKKLEDVSVQLKWFYQYQFAGIMVAKEKGFYEEEGLNVTIKERDPKQNNILQVINGEAEYGLADSVILRYRAEGHPVKVLATIFQHNAMVLISKKESGIVSPYEMKGKKISFQKGLDDSIISSLMSFANLGEDDYIKMPMDFSHMNFVNGEVDVCESYISIEPYWMKEKYNIDVNVIDPKNYGIDFYGDLIFTTEKEIKEHPQRVEAFKKATLKGWAYALNHQDEAIKIILEKYNTRELHYEQLLYEARITENLIATKYIPLGEVKRERFETLATLYATKGLDKESLDEAVKSLIYNPDAKVNPFLEYLNEIVSLIVILLILILALYVHNRRLKYLVHKQTKELLLEKEKAQEALRYKSIFLANMSHEIRTPLNAILGFVEQLKKGEHDPQRKKILDVVHNSGESLLSIINDILDISKIESEKITLDFYPTDIFKLFHNIDDLFSNQCSAKNINFSLKLSMKMDSFLLLDEVRFKQIVINLVGNAVKFTNERGNIEVSVYKKENMLAVVIKDDGIGIAQNKLEKIFNSFEQADDSTTRVFGGTGLGLSISHKLANLMGGEIKVSSELGKGSEFSLEVPYVIAEANIEEKKLIEESSPKQKIPFLGKILMVEDNKTNQLLLSMILDELELEYEVANDGIEAIEMFEKNSYRLILMDENMPRMNGIEAVRNIREIEKTKRLKPTNIVAVTANALSGDKERFIEAGMDDYIAKPYHEEEISRIIFTYLKA